jgi:hypothetical protein
MEFGFDFEFFCDGVFEGKFFWGVEFLEKLLCYIGFGEIEKIFLGIDFGKIIKYFERK